MAAGGGRARRALKTLQPPISAISPIPPTWREPMRWPSDLRASCARGWFAASKSADAGGGSTCGVRSIAMYRVADAFREAEAFIFHTRLAHVSPSLRDRDVTRAVDKLSVMAQGIGGGTR